MEMKNSGVAWIGEIPHDWTLSKIGSLYTVRNIKVNDIDYPPLSVTKLGILPQLETAAKTNAHDDRKLVKKGDFAINSRSDRRGSCGISSYDGSVSLINIVLKPLHTMYPQYYNWLFHTEQFADEFYCWGYGIVNDLWSTKWQEMKKIKIPSPPIQEQQSIAAYLDTKCVEIELLVSDIQQQIETLEQYKRSVITEAVTKGLNSDIKLKNSTIEWVDSLPTHWSETRIGYSAWLRARLGWKGLKADEYVVEGYPFLSAYNIVDSLLSWENLNFINEERYIESPEIKINIGDILLVKDGAGIGKCARIDELPMGKSTTNGSLAVITTSKELNYKYLYYYFLSSYFQNYIQRIINGMGVPHLSQEELRKIVIPLPPLDEQEKIADYLDNICTDIYLAIIDKKEQIETIEEYKKSLIFEYVTGKKEV